MRLAAPFPATTVAAATTGRACSGIELVAVVNRIAADARSWRLRVQLPDGDERWWTQLHAAADFDVWLLSWLPGHATDLHDHGGSIAAFTVVQGALRELRLDRTGRHSERMRRPGATTVVPQRVIHDVQGAGAAPTVSIHAYSPPLTTMNFYRPDATGQPQLIETAAVAGPER